MSNNELSPSEHFELKIVSLAKICKSIMINKATFSRGLERGFTFKNEDSIQLGTVNVFWDHVISCN